MSRTLLFTSLVALGLATTLATAAPKSVISDAKKQAVADARGEGRAYPLSTGRQSRTATMNMSGAAPTAA